jgi:hypothetical protein
MQNLSFSILAALGVAALAAACSDDSPAGDGGSGPASTGTSTQACGDGVVDPAIGETCDPPDSCQPFCCGAGCGAPADACTSYAAVGSAATCDLRCEETPITACVADGCCVAACGNDPDCSCDASGDCNACFQCANAGQCTDAKGGCEMSPECVDFVSCTSPCQDAACVDACEAASTPEAIALFQAWFSCALCDACPSSCMGFSNNAFQGCP